MGWFISKHTSRALTRSCCENVAVHSDPGSDTEARSQVIDWTGVSAQTSCIFLYIFHLLFFKNGTLISSILHSHTLRFTPYIHEAQFLIKPQRSSKKENRKFWKLLWSASAAVISVVQAFVCVCVCVRTARGVVGAAGLPWYGAELFFFLGWLSD